VIADAELTCETCGAQIVDPPKSYWQRPVRVCCKASLAKVKGTDRGQHNGRRVQSHRGCTSASGTVR
jgi:hypothetical protein